MSFWSELKRRNVVRVAVFYAVSSWLILQVADVLSGLFSLPDWTLRMVGFLLLLGLPLALAFSWVFELTPEGLRRERDVDPNQSITSHTGHKLNLVTIAVGLAAIALVAWQQLTREDTPDAADTRPVAAMDSREGDTPDVRTVAVLPFANLSDDSSNEYFADGVAEEVLNLLAKARDLRVISRSSAFSFKGQSLPIPEIASRLGASHVLEGSVRRAGDRVRVTAQLIAADDDVHLWSETFDRELTDIFAVQDEIAAAIAGALKIKLLSTASSVKTDLHTYDLILKGRSELGNRSREGIEQSIMTLKEATESSPDSAEAWGQLALAQLLRYNWYAWNGDDLQLIREFADRSLSLDPNNVAALTALASWHMFNISLDDADRLYRRALEINPNSVDAVNWYGDYLLVVNRLEDSIRYEILAAQLDPLLAVHFLNVGFSQEAAGNLGEAYAAYEKTLELDPTFQFVIRYLIRAYGRIGDFDAIERIKDRFQGEWLDHWDVLIAAYIHLSEGQLEKAQELFVANQGRFKDTAPFLTDLKLWDKAVRAMDPGRGYPFYLWPYDFRSLPEMLEASPEYAAFWRSPPRDRLLRARGHWVRDDQP